MQSQARHITRLISIMARLRGPNGCPWDREQSHQSIRHNLIEECYETVEAIDAYVHACRRHRRKSSTSKKQISSGAYLHAIEGFKQELGDLLLQVVFHSQMASEVGAFNFDDVTRSLCEKLIRRHPHIFGKQKAESSADVLHQWEMIKKTEKQSDSIIADLPKHLPALLKADKIQRKVARVGFDWKHNREVIRKIEEELRELKNALDSKNRAHFEEELGDLLFAVVNLARFEKLQAEDLLNRCIEKFTHRFKLVEQAVHRSGRQLQDCSLEELDAFWESAKHPPAKPRRSSPKRRHAAANPL